MKVDHSDYLTSSGCREYWKRVKSLYPFRIRYDLSDGRPNADAFIEELCKYHVMNSGPNILYERN